MKKKFTSRILYKGSMNLMELISIAPSFTYPSNPNAPFAPLTPLTLTANTITTIQNDIQKGIIFSGMDLRSTNILFGTVLFDIVLLGLQHLGSKFDLSPLGFLPTDRDIRENYSEYSKLLEIQNSLNDFYNNLLFSMNVIKFDTINTADISISHLCNVTASIVRMVNKAKMQIKEHAGLRWPDPFIPQLNVALEVSLCHPVRSKDSWTYRIMSEFGSFSFVYTYTQYIEDI